MARARKPVRRRTAGKSTAKGAVAKRPVARKPAPAGGARVAALEASVAALGRQLAAAQKRVTGLEDIEAIKRLQRIYGYYLDKALYSKTLTLFSKRCSIEISGRGIYRGREGVDTLLSKIMGKEFPEGLREGQLYNHFQLQGVVTLGDDGKSAKGRWRAFIQVAKLGKLAHWAEGPYEIEYVKQSGRWYIDKLTWFPTYYTPFEEGWAKTGLPKMGPSTEFPPDAPPSFEYQTYPSVFIPPFHYPERED
jgi:hypothetical protein